MTFASIRGQHTATDILTRALASNRVSQAYLFAGPNGVGKYLTARALAMALNCHDSSGNGCGECPSCRKILKNIHPDVTTVNIPEKKKSIPIDMIRELENKLSTRPHEGKAKVAIIDPADRMTEPAANALLKTLEEPPPWAFIVLVTARASSLLPTIRSRCQRVGFRPLDRQLVEELLLEKGADPNLAALSAEVSGGSMELAEAYLDEGIDNQLEVILHLLSAVFSPTPQIGLQMASQFSGKREDALGLLELFAVVLSELMWNTTHPVEVADRVLSQRLGPEFASLGQRVQISQVAHFIKEVHSTSQKIQVNNMNPQLALEGMVLSMRQSMTA